MSAELELELKAIPAVATSGALAAATVSSADVDLACLRKQLMLFPMDVNLMLSTPHTGDCNIEHINCEKMPADWISRITVATMKLICLHYDDRRAAK